MWNTLLSYLHGSHYRTSVGFLQVLTWFSVKISVKIVKILDVVLRGMV